MIIARRFALVAAMGGLMIASGWSCTVVAAGPAPTSRLSFSESLRHEQLTTESGGGFSTTTETQTASVGKAVIEAELPLNGLDTGSFDAHTPFTIKVGGFNFSSTLGADPEFSAGKTSAQLVQFTASASGNSRVTVLTAHLRWDRGKLAVKVEAKVPGATKPIAAEDFLEAVPGDVKAETSARVQLSTLVKEFNVPFRGHMSRKTAGGGSMQGEVVIVDLRGAATD